MKLLLELLLDIQGLQVSDELAYLFDLITGVISRRILYLQTLPGHFLLKDIVLRAKHKQNSLFFIEGRTDELLHILPYYERNIWEAIKRIVKPGDICIDVGSHIGTHAVPLALLVGTDGLVIAVEPSPLYKILEINVKINELENVILVNKALGSNRGSQDFYFTASRTGISSLHREWTISRERYREVSKLKVDVVPMDELLNEIGINQKRIKLLKIDVEGAQEDVLEGALNTLRNTDFVILEVQQQDVTKFIRKFKKCGFKNFSILEQVSALGFNLMATKR